jgi:hypothetical protein
MSNVLNVKKNLKRGARMPDTPKKEDKTAAAPAPARMAVRLAPVDNSDQPVLANHTAISSAAGMAFIDFGFLEPGILAAIPRVAKQGGKLPQQLNGKLAVRVAMGVDGIAALHQQLGRLLASAQAAAQARAKKGQQ